MAVGLKLALVASSALLSDGIAPLTLLNDSVPAKCLDGTPPGYFFEPATAAESSTKWVLWLQGGGECVQKEYCTNMSRTELGSSKYFKKSEDMAYFHLASPNEIENPIAAKWNRVMLKYCSQDLWSGMRTDTSSETFGFYFSGHLIIQEVVEHLKTYRSFGEATEIIFGGESAGGIGVWLNVGWIRDQANRETRVVAAPLAGFYSFAFPYMGADRGPDGLADFQEAAWPSHVHLWESHYDSDCARALGDRGWSCMLANYSRPYINVTAFVIEAQTDQMQLEAHDNVPQQPWSPEARSYVKEWQVNMTHALHALPLTDGYFSPACYIHTSFEQNKPLLIDSAANFVNYGQAFAGWYLGVSVRLEDTCGILCGHCAGEDVLV